MLFGLKWVEIVFMSFQRAPGTLKGVYFAIVSLAFYLFSPTRLINSIKNEHSCKILYVFTALAFCM